MSELRVRTVTVSDPDHLGVELNTLRDLNAPCTVASISHSVEQHEGGDRWTVLVVLEVDDEQAMDEAAEAVDARG